MVVLAILDIGGATFTIHKDYDNFEQADREFKLSHSRVKEYQNEDYVQVNLSLGTFLNNYGYLINTNTRKQMGSEIRKAMRDYKLNKLWMTD